MNLSMKMPISIAIVGIVGVPAKYGGFETLAQTLLEVDNRNYVYTVFCSKPNYDEYPSKYKNSSLRYIGLHANGVQSIIYDGLSLFKCINKKFDIILVLGTSGAVFIPLLKPFLSAKIIVNVDGIEWRRDKWNLPTKLFLRLSEYLAVLFSHKVIADNQGIYNYLLKSYNREAVVIPYGAKEYRICREDMLRFYELKPKEYFFSVCRVEPENNVELILETFCLLDSVSYVIVGNFNYSSYGRSLKSKYQMSKNIMMLDPVYDLDRLNQLRQNCKGYVHGHSAGGTNPSLVEAMALTLPILAFDVEFNRYTLNNTGFYFNSIKTLKVLLDELTSQDLINASKASFKVFKKNYTISKVMSAYWNCFDQTLA